MQYPPGNESISHQWERKPIFPTTFGWGMLVPERGGFIFLILLNDYVVVVLGLQRLTKKQPHHGSCNHSVPNQQSTSASSMKKIIYTMSINQSTDISTPPKSRSLKHSNKQTYAKNTFQRKTRYRPWPPAQISRECPLHGAFARLVIPPWDDLCSFIGRRPVGAVLGLRSRRRRGG